jgi:hypothetical protein
MKVALARLHDCLHVCEEMAEILSVLGAEGSPYPEKDANDGLVRPTCTLNMRPLDWPSL